MIVAYLRYIGARGTKFLGWHAAKKHTIAVPGRKGNFFDAFLNRTNLKKYLIGRLLSCVFWIRRWYFEPSRVKKSQFPDWHVQQRGFVRRFLWIEVLIVRRMQEPCHRFDVWMELIRESTNRCHWIPKIEIEAWKIAIRDHQPYPLCHGEHHHH